jgi:hypothetical protein
VTDQRTRHAIEASDTDELIRIVDGHAAARVWEEMLTVSWLCNEAVTRGKQLWAIPEYVRYRLALDAPGEFAGPAVTEGPTRFTLGPLPEVAASTKTWLELEPHLAPGPERSFTAHERVVRGEDLTEAAVDPLMMELPLVLQPWEPDYPVATYRADRVEAPTPRREAMPALSDLRQADRVDDADGCRALLSVVEHWVETSNGRAQAACVEGDAAGAVAALGPSRAALRPVTGAEALAWVAWAGASGGAHGRRRGAAAGRFAAWWVAHELAGLEWPVEPKELRAAVGSLRWHLWWDGAPDTGWALRIAVESPGEGLAWALAAVDGD